jgi:hypothetical protein
MSTTASGDESDARNREEEDQRLLYSNATAIATLAATLVGTIIICIFLARMWDEDEIKLHVLHSTIHLLQVIARLCGSWALQCEATYDKHVNALH